MQEKSWRWRIGATLLLLLLVVTPGPLVALFDGLPLTPSEALVGLSIVISIWTTQFWLQRRVRRWLLISWGILILLNIAGGLLLPMGWSVCLRRVEAASTLTTPCEPSATFRDGRRTFVVPALDFAGREFPLHFMNDVRAFNFHTEDQPNRESLRYSMKADAYFSGNKSDILVTTNLPLVEITFNGNQMTLNPDETLRLPLAARRNHLTVFYEVDRSDADAILVEAPGRPFYRLVADEVPRGFFVDGYVVLYWLIVLISGGILALSIFQQVRVVSRRDILLLSYSAAVVGMYWLSDATEALIIGATIIALIWLWARLTPSVWRSVLVIPIALLALVAGIYVQRLLPYDTVELLAGGDDPLSYEGYARIVALAPTVREMLQAGESGVFYYQPLYRYVVAGIHAVLGESLWGIYVLQLWLFCLLFVLWGRFFYTTSGEVGLIMMGMALLYGIAQWDISFVALATSVYQEALAWPLFFLAVLGLAVLWRYQERRWWPHLGLGFLWGVAVCMRTDLLPALCVVVVYVVAFYLRAKTVRGILGFLGGVAVPPLFILLRNGVIANTIAVLPRSGYVNLLPPLKAAIAEVTAETFSVVTLLWDIPRAYAGAWSELLSLLIGPYQSYLWPVLFLVVATVVAWWRPTSLGRLPLLLLWGASGSVFLFSLFFVQDNRLATVSFQVISAILLVSTIGASINVKALFAGPYRIVQQRLSTKNETNSLYTPSGPK